MCSSRDAMFWYESLFKNVPFRVGPRRRLASELFLTIVLLTRLRRRTTNCGSLLLRLYTVPMRGEDVNTQISTSTKRPKSYLLVSGIQVGFLILTW